jgi:hypothetical protein
MNEPNHESSLFRVMMIGTALSFGALAAIAVSMKDFFGGNAAFQLTWKTPVAFVAGLLAGWGFWRVVRGRMPKN